jgi:hypothetical protein
MGVPVSVTLQGQKVFLCCKACVKKAKADEKVTLARVAALKARPKSQKPSTGAISKEEAKARDNLAKLSAEDRKLAEAQRWCAVLTDSLLGSMGKPLKLMLKGKTVFLCCDGCQDEAKEAPDRALATVEKLKAKASQASRGRQSPVSGSKGARP